MKSRFLISTMVVSLALVASLGSAGTAKTIKVDCSKGDSINKALEDKSEELVIEISGMCQEKIVIDRKVVTLRGTDPSADGITGPVLDPDDPNDRALVTVYGVVRGVRLENLAIVGSRHRGLELKEEALVDVELCRFSGNGRAIQADSDSAAFVIDSEFIDNTNYTLLAFSHGLIDCTGCTIRSANGLGVAAWASGRVLLTSSKVEVPDWAVIAGDRGSIWADDVSLTGAIWAEFGSSIWLEYVRQEKGLVENYIGENSSLYLTDTDLYVRTNLARFANGTAQVRGYLEHVGCTLGAEFFCEKGMKVRTSTCGQCPNT